MEYTLEFSDMDFENDTTTRYLLFQPILTPITLPIPIQQGEELESSFKKLRDPGDHP
jgi:hypothetical protein